MYFRLMVFIVICMSIVGCASTPQKLLIKPALSEGPAYEAIKGFSCKEIEISLNGTDLGEFSLQKGDRLSVLDLSETTYKVNALWTDVLPNNVLGLPVINTSVWLSFGGERPLMILIRPDGTLFSDEKTFIYNHYNPIAGANIPLLANGVCNTKSGQIFKLIP